MLQHEPEETTVPNAAEARVTPDELSAALKALEDRQSSTVAIGSVVDELRLNATPEQIWDQVQKQRRQATAQTPPVQISVPMEIARPRRRASWLVATAVGLILAGVAIINSSTHTSGDMTTSGQTITISGDSVTEEVNAQGKDVVISGDGDKIVLHGKAQSITVKGDDDAVIADTADTALVDGDGDTMKWTRTPPPDLSDPSHRQHLPPKGKP